MDREWRHDEKSLFSVDGKLIIKGTGYHQFAPGLSLCIVKGAVMEIGNNFSCSHDAKILVFDKLIIGNDNMWSFDETILDSDAHLIFDENGNMISCNNEITFGDRVWLGCDNIVLKGASIPTGCIVAAGSTITSCVYPKNSIITSKGKVIKENIVWNKTLNYNG